jgi:hypothetical protein
MSNYREKRDQRIADDFHSEHMPCSFCKASTPTSDLAMYGARCRPCYDAYCAQMNPPKGRSIGPMTLAQKKALIASLASVGKVAQNPKRWAEVLRDKEQGGSYLTRVQRDAWREVLGDPSKQVDA